MTHVLLTLAGLLTLVSAVAAGWIWGHSTARTEVVLVARIPDPGRVVRDDVHDRFDEIVAGLNPDPEEQQ